jgi:UDP-N-acetylmuramyl pentapeptide synthase
MAFAYFRDMNIDVAVVEVGLGGRLDCTNIVNPIVSVITNISFDHTQFLGDTLAKIAEEKPVLLKKVYLSSSVRIIPRHDPSSRPRPRRCRRLSFLPRIILRCLVPRLLKKVACIM